MPSAPEPVVVLSCEHGTNAVPTPYVRLFEGSEVLLQTHRALDIGSADLARALARACGVDVHRAAVSRLLVDCNRSPRHRALFSEFTRSLPPDERLALLDAYYHPHRNAVTASVRRALGEGAQVWHVSVHTFTRSLGGRERNADVGLLYDPSRASERELCVRWQERLGRDGGVRVRRNYPYRGVADGLVTALRREFPDAGYAGIELEVCQDIAEAGGRRWAGLKRALAASLFETVGAARS